MDAISCIMLVMRPYPKELRSRVVAAVEQGELTIVDIASVFSVGLTFVKKMLRLHRAGEDLTPRHGGGPKPLLQDPERALLRAAVAKQPDVTLSELQALLVAHGSRAVSVPTLCRALQVLQLPRKKKSHRHGAGRQATSQISQVGEGPRPAQMHLSGRDGE
jgi:transposase